MQTKKIKNNSSVYTVELYASLVALLWVEQIKPNKVLVCSAALLCPVLNQVCPVITRDLLFEIMAIHSIAVIKQGTEGTFILVPVVGILGNERVDKL